MTCEKIGDPITTIINEPCEHHQALFTNNRIWLFGRKFVNQPSHNWGHNVALAGTYGVAFNITAKKWETPHHFSALSSEENVSEALFIFSGAIHILLFSAFGELAVKSLHKWTGTSWEPVHVQSFPPVCGDSLSDHVSLIVADGKDEKTKYFVSTVGHTMRVSRMKSSSDGVVVEHFMDIPRNVMTSPSGQAVSAVETDGRLLFFYGVHGCGFRWDNSRLVACDLNKKTCESVQVSGDAAPKWGFLGAHAHGLKHAGTWIHAVGAVRSGMTSSQYDGSIWALQNLTASPSWERFRGEVPASMGTDVAVDDKDGIVYGVGKEGVGRVNI
ncbi:unnamed protein product [Angiostrongylus costaricensis]|uniref:Fucose-specific lectin n=1 Tax=Angiostrongylus costaricensis TaxID=334426 RepID=A0A0R3PDK0_ANGCS|nr:unnamed protein product [Angiostrongylus costaricensis]